MSTLKMPLKNRTTTINQYNGGRSTSQISIYDYPEHLNPFYEDENHKRIRFWHIGTNYKNHNNDSRRGSVSLKVLRDMWAFKTFRLKKKSSNLGINKTSESPPPLRKDLDLNKNHFGTYDPRLRHTLANNMFNNSFLGNAPHRASLQDMRKKQNTDNDGVSKGFGFGRNDQYRSTIQTTKNRSSYMNSPVEPMAGQSPQSSPSRYVYGGSRTPQPRLRSTDVEDYNIGEISRGSSQMSVVSKNPFEEDDNDVVLRKKVTSKSLDINDRQKRYTRKKRRAPAPPIPIPQVIDEYTQIIITEGNNSNICDESEQITHLAVEIQKYIKSTDENVGKIEEKKVTESSDKAFSELSSNPCKICLPEEQSEKTLLEKITTPEIKLQNIEQNTTTIKINNKNKILHSSKNFKKDQKFENVDKSILKIIRTEVTNTEKQNAQENHCKALIIRDKKESSVVVPNQENSEFEKIEIKVNYEEVNSDIEKPNIEMVNEKLTNFIAFDNDKVRYGTDSVEQISKNYVTRTKITSPFLLWRSDDTEVDTTKYKHEQEYVDANAIELKIIESADNLSQKSETSNEIITEVAYVPSNNDDNEIKKSNLYTFKKHSKNDVNGHDNDVIVREKGNGNKSNNNATGIAAQHQRRRSVREIIESINRNQKLLKVNQSNQLPPKDNDANNNINRNNSNNNSNNNDLRKYNNIKPPPRKKHDLKMKEQLEDTNNDLADYEREIECIVEEMQTAKFDNDVTTKTDEIFDKLTNKINNNDEQNCENIFKKCEIKNGSNHESSPTSSNLDWNPVPKPKRTKKLSVELQEK